MMICEPSTHLTNHFHIIVDARNDEIGDLNPHTSIMHGKDGVEDWLEMTAADTLVDGVAEGFQVDVGCIKVG